VIKTSGRRERDRLDAAVCSRCHSVVLGRQVVIHDLRRTAMVKLSLEPLQAFGFPADQDKVRSGRDEYSWAYKR
jgi:hypothetical protein